MTLEVRAATSSSFMGDEEDDGEKALWVGVAWVMLADVVGTSVLTLDHVAAELGWGLLISFLVAALSLAIYTAILMSRTHCMLAHHGFEIRSMGDAARYTLSGKRSASIVYAIVYGYAFLGNATYMLILGQGLQALVDGPRYLHKNDPNLMLNLPLAVVIASVVCAPFCISVQNVKESVWLCFFNLILILIVVVLILWSLIGQGRAPDVKSPLFAQNLSFTSLFGASTNLLYSYAGHWMYFEMMATMQEPTDFPKVFLVNAPVQLGLYMTVACVSYIYLGQDASTTGLQNQIPWSSWFRIAGGLLFLHVVIVYLVKTVVLARFAVFMVFPSDMADARSYRVWLFHALVVIIFIALGAILSLVVPFFDIFMGLIGGLLAAPISFLFPVLFYCGALGRFGGNGVAAPSRQGHVSVERQVSRDTLTSETSRASSFGTKGVQALAGRSFSSLGGADSTPGSPETNQPFFLQQVAPFQWSKLKASLSWWEWPLFALLTIMVGFVMVVGTTAQINAILEMR